MGPGISTSEHHIVFVFVASFRILYLPPEPLIPKLRGKNNKTKLPVSLLKCSCCFFKLIDHDRRGLGRGDGLSGSTQLLCV